MAVVISHCIAGPASRLQELTFCNAVARPADVITLVGCDAAAWGSGFRPPVRMLS